MKRTLCVFFCFVVAVGLDASILNRLRHGCAVIDAQNGAWDKAATGMNGLLSVDYDNAQVLYDAGVAAYKTGQFEQAHAYFDDCCLRASKLKGLQERSYFNKGNACVELNKLEDALASYESVLKINPENSAAVHNISKVKEMLEQQRQQQKKDQEKNEKQKNDTKHPENDQQPEYDQNNQSNDALDSQKKDQSNNDQNNNDKKKDQSENSNEQQDKKGEESQSSKKNNGDDNKPFSEDHKKNDHQKNNHKQEKDQKERANSDQENSADKQQKPDVSQPRGNRNSDGTQKANKEQKSKKQSAQGQKKQQENKQEQKEQVSSENSVLNNVQKQGLEKNNEQAVAAAQQKNDDLFDKKDQWMARLLQEQENADKSANKRIVKSALSNTMVENNGQNCW